MKGPVAKKAKFGVDHICYVDDMPAVISKWAPSKIFVLDGINTDRSTFLYPQLNQATACNAKGNQVIYC